MMTIRCNAMCLSILLVFFYAFIYANGHNTSTLVPAIIIFGDSAVDVGNNNYLPTIFRSNFPPYGKDFNHTATGRFCNGKIATDITAGTLGFKTYPLPFLSPSASGKNLLIGANFASAGSGYFEKTAILNQALPIFKQLSLYKQYQLELEKIARKRSAMKIINEALYILSFGSSDFLQNYYINPVLKIAYSPDRYSDMLIGNFQDLIKELHGMGARRIGVTGLPPLGCMPIARTLFDHKSRDCVSRFNSDAEAFNKKLNVAATDLQKQLPGIKLAIFDIYKPFYEMITDPAKYGFVESSKGCCGTGLAELSILCNPKSPGTCRNASQYVFWDSVHPSQAANQVLAESLLGQGVILVT